MERSEEAAGAVAAPELSAWGRLRARWWFRWGMDGVILLAVVWAVMAWQGRNLLDSRAAAPPLRLATLDGGVVDLTALRGREVVLFFWAPWCGVCEAESGAISSLYHSQDGPEDAAVLSVALGYQDRAQVEGFVAEHGVDYPVLLGTDETAAAYRIDKFPTVYVLDEEGRIKSSTVGYSTSWGLRARLW